ncbi:SIR2 family NAD-dependent protein deacylase [Embleya hyalina]|uniref:protein acetyllysine N-acetyltransferase n=1 Tax=Embleya hyalina TaxID=516124 RepID=A0A401YEX7_9ACTN|nr:Sir2 family NAD-dependent protein deacetylase [Embleya hyalina]GCD93161.1 NAD-dependent deacetylase [Embleya hyalina]
MTKTAPEPDGDELGGRMGEMGLRGVRRLAVLTGAGISTASGLPDFRGPHGLWTRDPAREQDTHRKRYTTDPSVRARVWRDLAAPGVSDARPGAAHRALARLRASIVTQNVDGLHRMAGSPVDSVHELHGSLARARCVRCRCPVPMVDALRAVRAGASEPPCPACRTGVLRPDVALFGEHPDRDVHGRAASSVRAAEVLVVIGTSLRVRPAADLCAAAIGCGVELVIVNAEPTPYDGLASTVLRGDIEAIVPRLVSTLVAGGTPTR